MITFTLEQLYTWIGMFLWPFFRIAAFVGSAPVLGESSVPIYVKIGVSVILTVAISAFIQPFDTIPPDSWAAMAMIAKQVVIGMAMGFTMRIVFAAVIMAGELTGLQMGLSFASFFDPSAGNTSVLARLLNTLAMLIFIAGNGHLILVAGLARSFEIIPLAAGTLHLNGIGQLIEWSSQIFIAGMLIAMPMIVALLTINLSMGILNRTAQQLSVFSVGFPITLTFGLLLLLIIMPYLNQFMESFIYNGFEQMGQVMDGFTNESE